MSTFARFILTLAMSLTLALGAVACGDAGGDAGAGEGVSGSCTPDCADKECGDDGCGGQCAGGCTGDLLCDGSFQCVTSDACTDSCFAIAASCGQVCGVTCGTCNEGQFCSGFSCVDAAPSGSSTGSTSTTASSGGFDVGQTPRIEVQWGNQSLSNGELISFSVGAAEVGEPLEIGLLRVTNLGQAPLELSEISITSVPEGLFVLTPQTGDAMPSTASPFMVQPDGGAGETVFMATVSLVLDDAETSPTGTITVRSNSEVNASELLTFNLSAEGAEPNIQVTPATVEFGNVSEGESEVKAVTILNTGTGELIVTGFVLSGSDTFAYLAQGAEYPVTVETESQGVTFPEPITVAPGTSTTTSVKFSPQGEEPAEATLILFSNDPDAQSGVVVPISGNLQGPCISLNPKKVDFGGKLIGVTAKVEVEVLSCGEGPLTITGLSMVDQAEGVASSEDFGLNVEGLTGAEGSTIGPDDAPIEIPVNQTRTFEVTFTPDQENKKNRQADGTCPAETEEGCLDAYDPAFEPGVPVPDLGKVRIQSDAFNANLDVEVRGFGVLTECPTAVIVVQEGEEVIPQTKLHLIGSQSYSSGGSISKYEWEVQQPVGSQSVFLPSSSAPDPTFEVNVAGSYVFRLRVWDQNNEESCIAAEYTVFVNPDEAIHVELLWHTPLDPDETDEGPEAGADLDLHFVHPFATGEDVDGDGQGDGWFDQPFDCFWFNAHPNWGSLDPAKDDDPGLDLDDTDGAGPENVNLNQPQDGMTYRVGVHYWNDHDFGPSLATVRVYIYSSLVFQLSDVELINHAMWEVADIAWPSGEVTLKTDAGGSYKIIPDYNHPFFPTPD